MKQFFKKYSYCMVKLFITQCVLGLFGSVIALATAKAGQDALTLACGIFAIVFYAFLIYTYMWEIGAKEKNAIDSGRQKLSLSTGLFIGLGSHIPTFVLALIYTVLFPIATKVEGLASTICAISKIFLLFFNGMYVAVMSLIQINGVAAHTFGLTYFVISIPAIIVTVIAYYTGAKGLHFTKLLMPVTPEELEIKREKKRERDSNR